MVLAAYRQHSRHYRRLLEPRIFPFRSNALLSSRSRRHRFRLSLYSYIDPSSTLLGRCIGLACRVQISDPAFYQVDLGLHPSLKGLNLKQAVLKRWTVRLYSYHICVLLPRHTSTRKRMAAILAIISAHRHPLSHPEIFAFPQGEISSQQD